MAMHRRTFTPEFQAQAVQRVTEQRHSGAEVARHLDRRRVLARTPGELQLR